MRRVTCLMPTRGGSRASIGHAIRYFLRQSYTNSELLIIGDQDQRIDDIVPVHPRIHYICPSSPLSPPATWNLGCNLAKSDWVALWVADDWQADWRLGYSMGELARRPHHEIAGTQSMLFHDPAAGGSWMYEYPPGERNLLEGSVVFRKTFWERHRFKAERPFAAAMDEREWAETAIVLDNPDFYVALDHHGAGDYTGDRWSQWPGDLETIMGTDVGHYR